jgi:hypothetical protein
LALRLKEDCILRVINERMVSGCGHDNQMEKLTGKTHKKEDIMDYHTI